YQAVTAATRCFHRDFFGAGGDRPPRGRVRAGAILRWPAGAGAGVMGSLEGHRRGVGLRNIVLEAAIHARDINRHFNPRQRTDAPGERPPDWQLRENAWLDYYRGLTEEIEPISPHETPQMQALARTSSTGARPSAAVASPTSRPTGGGCLRRT